jgi:oxygen-independent coproporphyrinogen-3 oxidase
LGCGARSYTRGLHYSHEYAVGTRAVAGILADYVRREAADFSRVEYGFVLDWDEQRRRMLILSLLQAAGLSRAHYQARFGADVFADFPQLRELCDRGLAEASATKLHLTPAGLERSDALGPWLYSPSVCERMEAYAWR